MQQLSLPAQSPGQLPTDSVAPQHPSLQLSAQLEKSPQVHALVQVRIWVAQAREQDWVSVVPKSHCFAPQSPGHKQEVSDPVQNPSPQKCGQSAGQPAGFSRSPQYPSPHVTHEPQKFEHPVLARFTHAPSQELEQQ